MAGLRGVYDHLRAGEGDVLIVADHASNSVPTNLKNLGLSDETLGLHVAWDIGTKALAQQLSDRLQAEAIISGVSRLVIDKNRRLDQPGLVPDVTDGIAVPGNASVSEEAAAERVERYYAPYHAAIEGAARNRRSPILLSLHSFTPHMNGKARPWDCGLLYNTDERLARRAIAFFKGLGLCVGDNEPYPGNIYNATMDRHAEAHGHPYLMLEIRNDLLLQDSDITLWCSRVCALLDHLGI